MPNVDWQYELISLYKFSIVSGSFRAFQGQKMVNDRAKIAKIGLKLSKSIYIIHSLVLVYP